MKLSDIWGNWLFARLCIIPYTALPICPAPRCNRQLMLRWITLSGCHLYWGNELPPHIYIHSLGLFGGWNEILAIQHLANYNPEYCIWQLREVTSHHFVWALSQIHRWWIVAFPFLFRRLSNFTCTFLQTHLNPMVANPISIIKINQWQPVLKCHKHICDRRLLVQRSITNLFQTVPPPDNGLMLLPQKPHHSYFLPLVECTVVGLPHPFGKLLQWEFGLLQADCRFAFCTTQVWQIVTLISFIIFDVAHLQKWGQVHNPCDINFPLIH